jgi:RNA polymerase sigma factor (sigma-70 family)
MVLGVCRRVLNNPSDAEDAFQGTFIVLACKAGSIARPDLLASWLYRVAYRVALRARTEIAVRKDTRPILDDIAVESPIPETDWADLRPVLDEEIARLPAKYRFPVVLCYLEGNTNEEAQRLGCAKGTICSRLSWARERLQTRLARRGITLPAGMLASLLTAEILCAAVPVPLLRDAVETAISFLSGPGMPGAAPAAGTALAKGVLRAMFLARIRTAIVLVMVLGLVGTGAALSTWQPWAAGQPQGPAPGDVAAGIQNQKDQLVQPAAGGGKEGAQRLKDLLKKRRDAGRIRHDDVFYAAAIRLLDAEFDLCQGRAERLKACETHLTRMEEAREISRARVKVGQALPGEELEAEFFHLDAEIRLEREKAK